VIYSVHIILFLFFYHTILSTYIPVHSTNTILPLSGYHSIRFVIHYHSFSTIPILGYIHFTYIRFYVLGHHILPTFYSGIGARKRTFTTTTVPGSAYHRFCTAWILVGAFYHSLGYHLGGASGLCHHLGATYWVLFCTISLCRFLHSVRLPGRAAFLYHRYSSTGVLLPPGRHHSGSGSAVLPAPACATWVPDFRWVPPAVRFSGFSCRLPGATTSRVPFRSFWVLHCTTILCSSLFWSGRFLWIFSPCMSSTTVPPFLDRFHSTVHSTISGPFWVPGRAWLPPCHLCDATAFLFHLPPVCSPPPFHLPLLPFSGYRFLIPLFYSGY